MNRSESPLDDGLAGLPPAPLPPGFIARTMRAVRAAPRFRLNFLDLALPLFFGVFGIVLAGLALWLLDQYSPLWLLEARAQWAWPLAI